MAGSGNLNTSSADPEAQPLSARTFLRGIQPAGWSRLAGDAPPWNWSLVTGR